MLAAERKRQIIDYVTTQKIATIEELSQRYDVHEATIRRDLTEIEKDGILRRIHGGVVLEEVSSEPNVVERATSHIDEKQAIGEAAAALVEDGETIILDSGTTTYYVALALKKKRNVTILTNDLQVAITLKDSPQLKVIVTGGTLLKDSYMLTGMFTDEMLRQVRVHKAFIGTPAIESHQGVMHFDETITAGKRAMIQAAKEVIVVADHTKFGATSRYQVASPHMLDTIVTSSLIHPKERQAFQQLNCRVIEVTL